VAALIKEGLTPDDFAARYGGEEFVVLVAGECMENIRERIEEIRRKVEAMQIEPMDGRRVTISIGLHLYHEEEDKECFFRIADAALYQAKHNGKNQTVMG
ncbi:MAG TPA: GGDEF domain-containing protein, partial [Bacilli bacterium]